MEASTKRNVASPRTPKKGDSGSNPPPTSPPIPNINERLGQLRPSRELLEFYRRKIADYDEEHEQIVKKLESYKDTYQDQHKLQFELRQREDEITELQKAISDLQVYLFQEREHVLRLYAENDRLKIQELEDKKKIHQLLALSSCPGGEITYFMKEPPARAIVPQKDLPKSAKGDKLVDKGDKRSGGDAKIKVISNVPQIDVSKSAKGHNHTSGESGDSKIKATKKATKETTKEKDSGCENQLVLQVQTLQLHVESLHAQLEEQTKLAKVECKEQSDSLREDRRVMEEEITTRHARDEQTISMLTEKLQKTQDLLYDSTKDFLDLRYEGRANERHWMNEKDGLLQELDRCRDQIDAPHLDPSLNLSPGGCGAGCKVHTQEIQNLDNRLDQSHKLGEMYREQVIQLEDELSRIKEEGDVTKEIFQDRSTKMAKRLKLMNTRYQDLETRRNLEVEGFKNDIKNLRTRLKDVERQLYKVTMGMSDPIPDEVKPDNIDMHILRNIRNTAGRSKHIVGEIKNLKAKVYSMENDLRHL